MSQDPHYEREKQKYDNPVASREYLLELIKQNGPELSLVDLFSLTHAHDEDSRVGVQRRMRAMEREGQVIFTRQKKYAIAEQATFVEGKVIGHKDGFGFLQPFEGTGDLYIPAPQMKTVMHGDKVVVRITGQDRKGRSEVVIVRLLAAREEPIVGRYFVENGMGIVVPDDRRISHDFIVPREHTNGARQGQVVVISILQRPQRRLEPIAAVEEVLGEHMAPGMEIEMAIRTFDIPHQWPRGVTHQIKSLQESVPEDAYAGRVDLREMPLITIDGEDARDFDDAVYAEPNDEGGWRLWVAIADVSYYVRPGSALDKEAIERGNSVYFPKQVIPMLPEVLSNGLCSLNPNVDRLCMVCEMTVSAQGKLDAYQFYEAVMNSKARMTYNKVWAILQGDPQLYQRYEPVVPVMRHLYDLYRALKKARSSRGAIEFETQESQFIFNAQRKIEQIVPLVRNDAHKLIEECMILANVSAAKFLEKHQAPTLYRVHDEPDEERLTSFLSYLGEIGISHQINKDASASSFTSVMQKIADRPDQELIQTMLLRSMKQAVYDPDNIGHFGLSLDAYAHFTSPIRRYPDLVVHRGIKALLKKQGEKTAGSKHYSQEEVDSLGEQCSMTERRADEATRDVADFLKCEFMLDHVGDSFDGVIASVTSFGFFVRLAEFHIDGLVHISNLVSDYFAFDEVKQCLIGESSGRVFRLGDLIKVKVVAVNIDERKIDFLVDEPKGVNRKSSSKRAGAKKRIPKGAKNTKSGTKTSSKSTSTRGTKKPAKKPTNKSGKPRRSKK